MQKGLEETLPRRGVPRSGKAVDHAYHSIKKAIAAKEVLPGQHLGEEAWARRLDISRTPLREAFRRLGAEGWLEITPDLGVRVSQWSASDVDEIFEIRALIESHVVRRAATRVTAKQISALQVLATRMAELNASPIDEIVDERANANNEFHDLLVQAANSGRLQHILRLMVELPFVKWTIGRYTPEESARSSAHHFEMIAALKAGDPEWAASIMRSHILSARNAMLSRFSEQISPTKYKEGDVEE